MELGTFEAIPSRLVRLLCRFGLAGEDTFRDYLSRESLKMLRDNMKVEQLSNGQQNGVKKCENAWIKRDAERATGRLALEKK